MTATFYVGDAVTVMNTFPEKSVDLILTSPPFLALRSYLPSDHPDKALEGGSQATPGAYIDWLLDVVEACARVLAPHGSLVFELGDTYSGSGGAGGDYAADVLREGQPKWRGYSGNVRRDVDATKEHNTGIIPNNHGTGWPLAKSLSLIPETFRFAMVYGHNPFTGRKTEPWRLRNVIRWVRPNPPVGALGDKFRPATSELMVFCKAKDRFFDLDAVRSPTETMGEAYRPGRKPIDDKNPSHGWKDAPQRMENPAGAPPLDWWNIPLLDGEEPTRYGPKERVRTPESRQSELENHIRQTTGARADDGLHMYNMGHPNGPPPLDWWNIPPGGYPGAHYAVWPPELLVKPIKAMCPEKVCRRCGEPSRRVSATLNGERGRIATLISSQRQDLGLRRRDLVSLFIGHYKNEDSVLAQISNWELSKNVPVPRDWGLLKERLKIATDEFDELIEAAYRWNEAEYVRDGATVERGVWESGIPQGRGAHSDKPISSTRVSAALGFSDCGHDDYRIGVVLDPFAGSGTTLAVATGHGRDAIGIDLDERNYELSLDRVGPLILQRGTARRINS